MQKRPVTCAVIVVLILLIVLCVILLILRSCEAEDEVASNGTDEPTETEQEIEEVLDMLGAVFTTYDLGVDVVVRDVVTRSATEWYAVGGDSRLWMTGDSGATWTSQDAPLPGPYNTIGLYLGGNALVAAGAGGSVVANEDGQNWWPWATSSSGDFRDVFSWGDHVWIVGDGARYSPDNGSTWLPQFEFDTGETRHYHSVFVREDFYGWAVGDGVIARTMDGGFSGEEILFPNETFFDVTSADAEGAFVCGAGGTMLRSMDDTGEWSLVDVGTDQDLLGVTFLDANYGLTVGRNGGVFSTIDGGATWDERTYESDTPDFNSVSVSLFTVDDGALPDVVIFGPSDGGKIQTITAPLGAIFADGFESGDTSAWTD